MVIGGALMTQISSGCLFTPGCKGVDSANMIDQVIAELGKHAKTGAALDTARQALKDELAAYQQQQQQPQAATGRGVTSV